MDAALRRELAAGPGRRRTAPRPRPGFRSGLLERAKKNSGPCAGRPRPRPAGRVVLVRPDAAWPAGTAFAKPGRKEIVDARRAVGDKEEGNRSFP